MALIPLILDLAGVPCLVVGAGRVAERKIRVLRRAGARLTLVAPNATPHLRAMARRGVLKWRRRAFRLADLRGARLVFVATADRAISTVVARVAARRGLFANVADDPDAGSIQMPALLRRGPLIVAISTSGRSPGAARALRDDLARRLGREYADYVAILGTVRGRLLKSVGDEGERGRRMRALLRAPILHLLRHGRAGAARAAARRAAGIASRSAR